MDAHYKRILAVLAGVAVIVGAIVYQQSSGVNSGNAATGSAAGQKIQTGTETAPAEEDRVLRIFTWDGYVTAENLADVNELLKNAGYDYTAEVISPFADNAEQMYDVIRNGDCDISFLTLFFIQMQDGKMTKFLRPIDTESPRLTNYKHLKESYTQIDMGVGKAGEVYYIPFGGGTYGFWANMDKIADEDLPRSFYDLTAEKWKGHYSLNISQPWYNVSYVLLSMGLDPFLLNELISSGKRDEALALASSEGELQKKINLLYRNAGNFWTSAPTFDEELWIVSGWGIEMKSHIENGEKWKKIDFEEGNLLWMDTINFTTQLSGKKLEAAEIVANYFISNKVQERVATELSVFPVTEEVVDGSGFYDALDSKDLNHFVPPFEKIAENLMNELSRKAQDLAK